MSNPGLVSPLTSRLKAFKPVGNEYIPVIVDDNGIETDAVFYPLPGSQQLFLSTPEFEVLYEGTRGPGKTLTLLMDFCQDVGRGWGAEWKGMIIRRTYPELADVISMSKKWIKRIWPGAFYNEIKSFWQFPDGELLYFSPIRTEEDYNKHHGTNFTWLGWEELTLWPDDHAYKRMMSVIRSTMRGIPLRLRATTNPYGVGHNWVQARFQLYNWPKPNKIIGPLILGAVDEKGVAERPRKAIHGRLSENIILMKTQPLYVQQIRAAARNKAELDAWMDGLWDIAAGGMFDDIWYSHRDAIVVPDFTVPLSWRITRAYDHGSSKPWSCGYYAESDGADLVMPDGRVRSTLRGDLFRVGEVYGWHPGQPNVGRRMLISEIKKELIEYEIKRGWRDAGSGKSRVRRGPADTGIFDDVNGVCIADDFEAPIPINGIRHRGIIWEKADKGPGSREQGWEQLRKRLKATKRPDGRVGYREEMGLFICECCIQWLRTVPTLPRDEKKIDDVDSDAEDHCGDETRYRLRYETRTIMTRHQ